MKKIALFCFGLMASAGASAVEFEASGNLEMADCVLLKENVRLNLSTGVVAGVSCDAAGLALSACHTKGKVTSRTVNVRDVPESIDPPIPAHIESCNIGDAGCEERIVVGPAMPTATTALGTVNTQYPGGNECTSAGAEANSQVHQPR